MTTYDTTIIYKENKVLTQNTKATERESKNII